LLFCFRKRKSWTGAWPSTVRTARAPSLMIRKHGAFYSCKSLYIVVFLS
jgi:hypothetical protein